MLDSFPPISGDCNFWTRMTMMPMKSTKLICRNMRFMTFNRLHSDEGRNVVFVSFSLTVNRSSLTMIEASTGPFITHQMAALSFMSQHLRKQVITHSAHTVNTHSSTWARRIAFRTHPMSSKCSLSTAQMVTHTVGVPVPTETWTSTTRDQLKINHSVWCV